MIIKKGKLYILLVCALLVLTSCTKTSKIENEKKDDSHENNNVIYIGTTYDLIKDSYDITNYDLLVENGAKITKGEAIAKSKDANLVKQEIDNNNKQIAILKNSIKNIINKEQATTAYYTNIEKEIISLNDKKKEKEKEISAISESDKDELQGSLYSELQTILILIDNKQSILDNKAFNSSEDNISNINIQISNLELANQKLSNNQTLYATTDGIVNIEEDNVLQIIAETSYVKVSISEKEINYFNDNPIFSCKVVYLNEEVDCSFLKIDDNNFENDNAPFTAIIKLEKKYYKNLSVEVTIHR